MGLFRNKYQIVSNRLNCWDYSSPRYYFVSICVKNMKCDFGQIIDHKMNYSEIGRITAKEWIKTAMIRSNIALDQWVVMPNHFHGIIQIKNNKEIVETTHRVVSTPQIISCGRTTPPVVGSGLGRWDRGFRGW